MTVQMVFESVWHQFAAEHGSEVISQLASVSRNPFVWHNVIQGLMHASTWPGTALAYRQLIGAILFGDDSSSCDSTCEYCGSESIFQTIANAFHTGLNYPRRSPKGNITEPQQFMPRFLEFVLDVSLSRSSPFREGFSIIIAEIRERRRREDDCCPISVFPSLIEFFSTAGGSSAYFFGRLKSKFRSVGVHQNELRRKRHIPSISSFFIMLGAKMFEGSIVEGGRNFDSILLSSVSRLIHSLPEEIDMYTISPVSSPMLEFRRSEQSASALIQIIKHSLVAMFLPPTEWSAGPNQSIDQIVKNEKLERCTQFMEPSAVLSVIRYLLTRPGVIPTLSGNNEGKFNYVISKVRIVKFDLDRCVCLLKSLKTSASPVTTPMGGQEGAAKLALIVKEVNVQVEHEWRIEWNSKRYGSYYGTNTVTVRGLSSQVNLTLFADDQGPVIDSATISLGHVEHSCSILNSNFISEMVAQAALDWFAEPLTRLLQNASQTALDQFLKTAAIDFRIKIWNQSIIRIVPSQLLSELVSVLNDHLPKHGVPI